MARGSDAVNQFQTMNKTTWVTATLSLFLPFTGPAQNLQSGAVASDKQLQLSIQNGLSSFLVNQTLDSVYFLKAGYHAGVQGNYFWNSLGVAGRAGYFANGIDRQALEDFARRRRTPRDRMQLAAESFKGLYLFTGPAFQSTFNKWRIQSSIEGGLISKPASQVLIADNVSPDIVYYRNVFDESNSFAWSAGLSVSYAISRQFLLGVNADYLNTKNEVVNYDIQRGNGREAKNITSQAGFLNTGLRVSYLFNSRKPRDAASGLASGKRQHKPLTTGEQDGDGLMHNTASNAGKSDTHQNQNDTCRCEDKVMDVKEMSPYIVEIRFASVEEAKEFLDTYEPLLQRRDVATGQATGKRQHMSGAQSNPLYEQSGNSGTNPLYQSKRTGTISNAAGTRGIVQRNAKGEQEFYLLPAVVDLAEVLSYEDGRVTVHVQNNAASNTAVTRDHATGQATGKRQYKAIAVGDMDGDGVMDLMLRSGGTFSDGLTRDINNDPAIAWGGMIAVGDVDGDGRMDYCLQSSGEGKYHLTQNGVMHKDDWMKNQRRDHATGLATGKRQHKPMSIGDLDGDGSPDLLLISYGHEIKSPRDVASGLPTGRINKIEALTVKQGIVLEADLDGDGGFEPLQNIKSPRDVASGQATGKRMAGKEDVYVWKIKYAADLDGDGLADGFVCSGMNKDAVMLRSNVSKTFSLVIAEADDETSRKLNDKATEGYQSWNESASGKVVDKATSGVKQTMQTQVRMPGDSSDNANMLKAGVSTSRSNIRTHKMVSSSNGNTVIECEIELNGRIYTAVITARHDTAKNAIGNIR